MVTYSFTSYQKWIKVSTAMIVALSWSGLVIAQSEFRLPFFVGHSWKYYTRGVILGGSADREASPCVRGVFDFHTGGGLIIHCADGRQLSSEWMLVSKSGELPIVVRITNGPEEVNGLREMYFRSDPKPRLLIVPPPTGPLAGSVTFSYDRVP